MRTYLVPAAQALLLHLLVLFLFLSGWDASSNNEVKPQPRVVKAKVMTMEDPIAARKKKQEAERKAAAKRAADKKKAAEARRKRELEKKRRAEAKRKAEQKKLAEKKRRAAQKKKDELKRKQAQAERLKKKQQREKQLADQLKRERELEMARALDEESELLESQSSLDAVMSYVALIQDRVIRNWHRPLSARNGMQVLLMIHLVPTGEVNNVYVLKGSGNAAFDRSAVQAVQRAEKFEELQQLSPRQFDANFRQFKMLFKPEDLIR